MAKSELVALAKIFLNEFLLTVPTNLQNSLGPRSKIFVLSVTGVLAKRSQRKSITHVVKIQERASPLWTCSRPFMYIHPFAVAFASLKIFFADMRSV